MFRTLHVINKTNRDFFKTKFYINIYIRAPLTHLSRNGVCHPHCQPFKDYLEIILRLYCYLY